MVCHGLEMEDVHSVFSRLTVVTGVGAIQTQEERYEQQRKFHTQAITLMAER